MYSSEKFLSPIVIAGFPVPGELELPLVLPVLELLVDSVEDDLLLPHAASTNATAKAIANPATTLQPPLPGRLLRMRYASWLFTLFIRNIDN
jgi:hypothetical protein